MQLATKTTGTRRGQAGFTLSEVLVATTLTLLAITAFLAFSRHQLFALRNQSTQVDVQTTARSIVDAFSREVRKAGANPNCGIGNGFNGMVSATSSSFRFQSDFNGDADTFDDNEDLTYRYNAITNAIERVDNNANTTDQLVSGYTVSGSLRYFDANNAELVPGLLGLNAAQRSSIRRVRIQVGLTATTADPTGNLLPQAQVASDVDLRNRFFVNATVCPGS